MINNELLKEVIEVSNKNQYISKDLLLRIVYNVIENSNPITKSTFSEIKFINSRFSTFQAQCFEESGLINVFYNLIKKDVKHYTNISYLLANLLIIQVLLHEIEHLNEAYKATLPGLKGRILKINSSKFMDKMWEEKSKVYASKRKRQRYIKNKCSELNSEYWSIYPCEKIAEVDSMELLLRSLDNYPNFKKTHKKEYIYLLKGYIDRLKQGYIYDGKTGKYNSPLKDYLNFVEHYVKYEDLGFVLQKSSETKKLSERFSVEERMKLGLPVSLEEIKSVSKKIFVLKSTK